MMFFLLLILFQVLAVSLAKYVQSDVPDLMHRNNIAYYLNFQNFTRGVELGVAGASFSKITLEGWSKCEKYILVDLWGHQENYNDAMNKDQANFDIVYNNAMLHVKAFKDKLEVMRMYTSEAAKKIPDNSVDYVYVDARHDYCGVMEDLENYWPKIRPNGIMAGDDFIFAAEGDRAQDWSLCADGTTNPGAVKGAVIDFCGKRGLKYYEIPASKNWVIRKPFDPDTFTVSTSNTAPSPADFGITERSLVQGSS